MATPAKKIPLSGLARKFITAQLLDEATAYTATEQSTKRGISFVSFLVSEKIIPANKMAMAASEEFGIPLLDLNTTIIDPDVTKLVKIELIEKHHVIPLFKRGKRLYIAVSDPTNLGALDEIKFAVGMNTDAILVEDDKLEKTIESIISNAESNLSGMKEEDFADEMDLEVADQGAPQAEETSDIDDAPVVKFVNHVLLDAIKKGASDLHFEPYEKYYRVRFRVDGVLTEVTRPPLALTNKISARIKVMSRLDVSEKRIPQDGRIKLKLSKNKSIDFRVSTCPTLFGEKTVMRILDSDAAALQIDQLGYEDHQKEAFLENLYKPYGMFLVTGPTGSGKTVSLYTGINILNQVDINISTAEDPVEINLPGVNQVQVDERTGMTFEKALKAFLRQDPDIILVGEVRDLGTASIAVKAAQTGHMVMSTLHTNDAPQTLTRLQDMGIQPFAVATSINLITGQRLCRRLHPDFKVPLDIPAKALLAEGYSKEAVKAGIKLFSPGEENSDCPSGYKGRAGIYQVMPVSDALKRLIIEKANAVQLADQAASEGIWDIRRSGLEKAKDGITSLAEVNRVTVE